MEKEMSASGILFIIAILVMIISFFVASENENKESQKKKEEHINKKTVAKQKEKDDISSEKEAVAKARDYLPDTNKALNYLHEKFPWYGIIETISIFPLHIKLLNEIAWDSPKNIRLPNMQSDGYGDDEHHVIEGAKNAYSKDFLYEGETTQFEEEVYAHGIEAISQAPTVNTLRDLVNQGYVTVNEEITTENRNYTCSITKMGKVLVELNMHYEKKDRYIVDNRRPPSMKTRNDVSSFLFKSLALLSKGA